MCQPATIGGVWATEDLVSCYGQAEYNWFGGVCNADVDVDVDASLFSILVHRVKVWKGSSALPIEAQLAERCQLFP